MYKIFFSLLLFCSSFQGFGQYHLKGECWYDAAYNNQFDIDELPLRFKNISVVNVATSQSYTVQTDQFGYYDIAVPEGEYIISYDDEFDQQNYILPEPLRAYAGTYIYMQNLVFFPSGMSSEAFAEPSVFGDNAVNTSGGQNYQVQIKYGFTDQYIATMPARITIRFNPLLTLTSSSPAPTLSVPGYAAWNFNNVSASDIENVPPQVINCNFSVPVFGDTIQALLLKADFEPGIPFSTPLTSNGNYSLMRFMNDQPLLPGSGITSGKKWTRAFNGNGGRYYPVDFGNGVDTAYGGNEYFVFSYQSLPDGAGSIEHIFVSRINHDGLPVWENSFSPEQLSIPNFDPNVIKSTPDGGCIVFGKNALGYDIYGGNMAAIKFSATGQMLWQREYSGFYTTYIQHALITPAGDLIVSGNIEKSVARHPGINTDSTLGNDLLIAKISSSGDLVWTKVYGGTRPDAAFKTLLLQDGSLLVLGATSSNDGDVVGSHPREYTLSDTRRDTSFTLEGWILHLDANGNMLWNKCYGGSREGYFTGAAESNGGILLSGFTRSKNGDLPYYTSAHIPLWLLHISTSGNINWSKIYPLYPGYQDSNYVHYDRYDYDWETEPSFFSLHPTRDGNFVAGGHMFDRYGPVKATHGELDFSFIKINPAGDLLWQKSIGSLREEFLSGTAVDRNDDIIFLGSTSSNEDDMYGFGESFDGRSKMVMGKVGITNVIKGRVFVDNNNNGIFDAGERLYSNGIIQTAGSGDTLTSYLFDGRFFCNTDTGRYTSTFQPFNSYYTAVPAAHSTVFNSLDQLDSFDVALRPVPNIPDLEIDLIPLSIPRPGFENIFRIVTKNTGTATLSNVVVSLKKDTRISFVSASRDPAGTIGDSAWWGPLTLAPFQADTLELVLENAAPPLLNNGDTLKLEAIANPVVGDSSANNNKMSVSQIVQGSFDPNDKTEIHGGQLTPLAYSNNEYLQYVIRFQNTGTDTAFFVTVKDTLDATKYNLSSLQVVAASHTFEFNLEGNVATWNFKMIKLVDSLTDESKSNGYIVFKIKPSAGLSLGDAFTNKAAIYFDYNLPVITNEEKTFISDGSGICPGGNIQYKSSKTGNTYQWQVNNGSGYTNITNSTVYSGTTTSTLQITGAPTTLYGSKFRCLVNANTYSAESQLKFVVSWTGAISTDWQIAGNWNCGVIPDGNTDVLLRAGYSRYPVVNNGVSCRSIKAQPGTSVLVRAGVQLSVMGK